MADAQIRAVITADDQASAVLKNFSSSLNNAKGASDNLLKGLTLAGAAIGTLGAFGINSAKNLQTASQSMSVLTGNTAEANRVIGQLYQFVLGKPITFPDAAEAAKTLLGYGVAAQDVVPDVEAIGKISVTTGANLSDVALAFGQVNAKGRLMGQEALQLVNNSIPITNILAKELGLTIQETAQKMDNGGISAQQFNKAIIDYSKTLDISQFGNTLQNRLISLQGSLRALAFNLLGIKIDPIQGFVVEAGGLFDRFSSAVDTVAKNLKLIPGILVDLRPYLLIIAGTILGGLVPAFAAWAATVIAGTIALAPYLLIGAAVGLVFKVLIDNGINPLTIAVNALTITWNFLKPSLMALWNTVQSQLLPSLQQLWTLVSPILIPALKLLGGVALVAVIGSLYLLINVLNLTILGISSLINWSIAAGKAIYSAFATAANLMVTPFRIAFNAIASLWNGTVGKIHFSIPNWVPGIGGKEFGVPTIPTFATGGVVPGSMGAPTLALVHGGERVIPTGGMDSGGGTINITLNAQNFMGSQIEARKFAQTIVDNINDIAGKKNMTGAQMLGAN